MCSDGRPVPRRVGRQMPCKPAAQAARASRSRSSPTYATTFGGRSMSSHAVVKIRGSGFAQPSSSAVRTIEKQASMPVAASFARCWSRCPLKGPEDRRRVAFGETIEGSDDLVIDRPRLFVGGQIRSEPLVVLDRPAGSVSECSEQTRDAPTSLLAVQDAPGEIVREVLTLQRGPQLVSFIDLGPREAGVGTSQLRRERGPPGGLVVDQGPIDIKRTASITGPHGVTC